MDKKKLVQLNQRLKDQIDLLEMHNENLKSKLNTIESAKTFKLWQKFNKYKKILLHVTSHPILLVKTIGYLFTKGPREMLDKINSQVQSNQQQLSISEQYKLWFAKNYPTNYEIQSQKLKSKKFSYKPLISIITPTYNTPEKFLRECIESVINQSYSRWELCLVDDASLNNNTRNIIKEYVKKRQKN